MSTFLATARDAAERGIGQPVDFTGHDASGRASDFAFELARMNIPGMDRVEVTNHAGEVVANFRVSRVVARMAALAHRNRGEV